jgi:hypothetical protein
MMSGLQSPPLPYTPPPFPGELLSSWLRRIADEYAIDLPHLARHIGLPVCHASQIDRELSLIDLRRAAAALRSETIEIHAMVHSPRFKAFRPSSSLLQLCLICRAVHRQWTRLPVVIRAWFEFWQIECASCGLPFSSPGRLRLDRANPAREDPLWFESLRRAARAGARRLADFARRPFSAGWSPLTVLRLLSMRFDAILFTNTRDRRQRAAESLTPRRLVELFVPGLADRWCLNLVPEPWTKERPVRLVTARTILFAGMTEVFGNRIAALAKFHRVAAFVRHSELLSLLSSLSVNAT